MRALCMGDVHLGTRTHGIDRLEDQAGVLGLIAAEARLHECDVVLCGGDVFEGPLLDPREEAAFAAFVLLCRRDGIPVVTTVGNGRHDMGSREAHALTVFHHVPGVTVLDIPTVHYVAGMAVCALPWTPVSRLVAENGAGDRDDLNAYAAELLLLIARDLRAQAENGPAVLLLHWSISGASLPTGLAIDEHAREPILPLDDLSGLGFDAVVASHIHKPQLMNEQPPVFYTGSPLPLNFGEATVEHGCWLLDVGDGPAVAEFVPLRSRRLVVIDGDSEEEVWPADIIDAIVKVRTSEGASDRREIERNWLSPGAYRVIVEAAPLERASRARVADASADMSEDAAIRAWCTANQVGETDRDGLLALAGEWAA